MRSYLDPFEEYTDPDIWKVRLKLCFTLSTRSCNVPLQALSKAQLDTTVASMGVASNAGGELEGLGSELSEGGENLSVGQRQMMVLARALLKDAKVA